MSTIGQRIKKLRRERDITQEQLAEYLNLSPSAISQWECDRVMPDISQLPLLANLFEVSADTLLGINVEQKSQKIAQIKQSSLEANWSGDQTTAVTLLRDGLKLYPDSFLLLDTLATALLWWKPTPTPEMLRETEDIVEKIRNRCTDDRIRYSNLQTAIALYARTNRRDQAIRLAESAPSFFESRELLIPLYTGTKQYETMRDDIVWKFTNSIGNLTDLCRCTNDDGTPVYTDDEKLAIYEKQIALFALFFDESDYLYHAQFPKIAHMECAELHAKRGNREETLTHLEKAYKFVVEFLTQSPDAVHTSLLARGIGSDPGWQEDSNLAAWMLDDLTDTCYDFVRNDARFQDLVENIKIHAK